MTKFLGLDFKTTKDTFMPRPETELLVKVCLDTLVPFSTCTTSSMKQTVHILDIGTGTGNIAISLTRLNPNCKIVALDNSEEALNVAKENAMRLGVPDRIEFVKSDLFSSFVPFGRASINRKQTVQGLLFDIIISNPPYIPNWEMETLAYHVKDEPRVAIDGGEDGLDYYKKIIKCAPEFLKDGGYLIMEMGYSQSCYVKKLLKESGNFEDIEIFKDFSNIDRVIKAKYPLPFGERVKGEGLRGK